MSLFFSAKSYAKNPSNIDAMMAFMEALAQEKSVDEITKILRLDFERIAGPALSRLTDLLPLDVDLLLSIALWKYHFGLDEDAHKYLDRAKDMFTGKAMQEQMRVSLGETIVNSEPAMTAWLYAGEYHRDKTKMIAFLKGRALPPESIMRPLLMLLLRSKIDAILALGNIIHRMFSSAGEISAPDA